MNMQINNNSYIVCGYNIPNLFLFFLSEDEGICGHKTTSLKYCSYCIVLNSWESTITESLNLLVYFYFDIVIDMLFTQIS